MKKLSLLLFMMVFCIGFLSAQRNITGTVSDELGEPLIGATVLVKGFETTGVITELDGTYSIDIPEGATILIFSYTGFDSKELEIGTSTVLDVELIEGIELEEVVVTALGIEREERSLGYSVDQMEGEEFTKSRSTNIVNALQGKVSGVQVQSSSGNLGGSSKVIIRGITSLSGRNAPLWVVDGIPINDSQFATGSRITGSRDFGNGASVLNPDDIESLSVLKGAAATALYGSRAAAGAILVTTKRGGKSSAPKVTVNSSFRLDNLFRIPDYQQEYAMGSLAKYDSSSLGFDWGPLIAGQTVSYLPVEGGSGVLTPVEDNGIKEFFETGYTAINNIAVSDGNEFMDYRVSFGVMNQTGIVPGSELDRYNISLNTGFKHSDKFESRFGVQFIKTETSGTAAAGANDPNIIGLGSFSSTLDPNVYKPWIDENGQHLNQLTPTSNNPYWIRNENRNDRDDSRILANASLSFSPIDKLKITGTLGYDFDQDNRFLSNRKGTAQRLEGNFTVDKINNIQINTDILATYDTDLSSDLSLNALVGFNFNKRRLESESLFGNELLIPELFSPGNASQTVPGRTFREQILFGTYGSFELDYKNFLALTLTGRNDWASTLPKNNNSYFYPSASLAFVFTEAIPGLEGGILNFGKLRGSWAQVGNDTGPYQLDFNFFPITQATGQYSLNVNFPFDGRLAFAKANTIPPTNLKPEDQKSWEVGAELDFFDSRIGLDIAYFNTSNQDQILALPIPESTGFGNLRTNVGQVNTRGYEITLEALAIKSSNFRWNALVNFSTAEVEIASLTEGVDRVLIASAFNSVQVVAEVGKGFELLAVPFLRDSLSGRPIINPLNGTRQAGEAKTMGSVLPDFTMGFVNSMSFGDFNFSFTVDWRSGGVMKSSTVEGLQTGGLTQETLLNRNGTFIDAEGVLENSDGTFRNNDVPLRDAQHFWTALNDASVAEPYIFDASFVKLREVRLDYTLPSRVLGSSFIRSLTIGLEARNVALLYSEVPHIDPEANLFGSASDGFGVERASTPSTRSVGVNLRMQF